MISSLWGFSLELNVESGITSLTQTVISTWLLECNPSLNKRIQLTDAMTTLSWWGLTNVAAKRVFWSFSAKICFNRILKTAIRMWTTARGNLASLALSLETQLNENVNEHFDYKYSNVNLYMLTWFGLILLR